MSGDMMSQDNEGFFTYQGRADDLMKVSGKWLSPREVENCLLEHDSVSEAAVIGVETSEGLIKPAAFIVLDDVDASPELATLLQDHVKTTLEPYKYPRVVTFLPDLPRTHLGKVDRGALRRSQAV